LKEAGVEADEEDTVEIEMGRGAEVEVGTVSIKAI
jgi:hypothetical protein